MLLREGIEEIGLAPRGLGAAEHQQAARLKGEMKELEDPILGVRRQVDEQIPAADHVELGERRIGEQVVDGERHRIAHLLGDLEVVPARLEKSAEALGRDLARDGRRIDASAGEGHGIGIHIARVDLKLPTASLAFELLEQEHGPAERLFPRGAPRHPDPERPILGAALEQSRNDVPFEIVPDLTIAEEVRHADQ